MNGKIIERCYTEENLPNWFSMLKEKWRCDKGDNPECKIDNIEIREELTRCVSDLQKGCDYFCALYEGNEKVRLLDKREPKFGADGPLHLREIKYNNNYRILIQLIKRLDV